MKTAVMSADITFITELSSSRCRDHSSHYVIRERLMQQKSNSVTYANALLHCIPLNEDKQCIQNHQDKCENEHRRVSKQMNEYVHTQMFARRQHP